LLSELFAKYFEFIILDKDLIEFVNNKIENLALRIILSDKAHEEFLQKN
jgi:hypothetical protein